MENVDDILDKIDKLSNDPKLAKNWRLFSDLPKLAKMVAIKYPHEEIVGNLRQTKIKTFSKLKRAVLLADGSLKTTGGMAFGSDGVISLASGETMAEYYEKYPERATKHSSKRNYKERTIMINPFWRQENNLGLEELGKEDVFPYVKDEYVGKKMRDIIESGGNFEEETETNELIKFEKKYIVLHELFHCLAKQDASANIVGGVKGHMIHEGMTEYLTRQVIYDNLDYFASDLHEDIPFFGYKSECKIIEMFDTIFPGSVQDIHFGGREKTEKYVLQSRNKYVSFGIEDLEELFSNYVPSINMVNIKGLASCCQRIEEKLQILLDENQITQDQFDKACDCMMEGFWHVTKGYKCVHKKADYHIPTTENVFDVLEEKGKQKELILEVLDRKTPLYELLEERQTQEGMTRLPVIEEGASRKRVNNLRPLTVNYVDVVGSDLIAQKIFGDDDVSDMKETFDSSRGGYVLPDGRFVCSLSVAVILENNIDPRNVAEVNFTINEKGERIQNISGCVYDEFGIWKPVNSFKDFMKKDVFYVPKDIKLTPQQTLTVLNISKINDVKMENICVKDPINQVSLCEEVVKSVEVDEKGIVRSGRETEALKELKTNESAAMISGANLNAKVAAKKSLEKKKIVDIKIGRRNKMRELMEEVEKRKKLSLKRKTAMSDILKKDETVLEK